MKRSALTAYLRVFLPGNDQATVYYADISNGLQFVGTCDANDVVQLAQEFAQALDFDGYEVSFSGPPSALEKVQQVLRKGQRPVN